MQHQKNKEEKEEEERANTREAVRGEETKGADNKKARATKNMAMGGSTCQANQNNKDKNSGAEAKKKGDRLPAWTQQNETRRAPKQSKRDRQQTKP